MYGAYPGARHGLAAVLVLTSLVLAGPVAAQGPVDSLVVTSVVPPRLVLRGERAHVHVEGRFPHPTRTLLTRLRIHVRSDRFECELGWSENAVAALVAESGLPWLLEADLFSGGEMGIRRQCGTIDGIWSDKVELTLRHPALLAPGRVTIDLTLHPAPDRRRGSRPVSERAEVTIAQPFRVLAHLPEGPVADEGEELGLTLIVEGRAPTAVSVRRDGEWHPVRYLVRTGQVRVVVSPQLFTAPGDLVLRVSREGEAQQLSIPVCRRRGPLELDCPKPGT
ncbi:MAG: hypothetical protein OEO23_12320 [Gemmatimonadota bacterium]|nr:hypothetical protein [Gemmatimonadota bacterium]